MKSAKITLIFIAILGIVGGALAFKAERFSLGVQAYAMTTVTSSTVGTVVYSATGAFCVTLPGYFINTSNDQGIRTDAYSTAFPFTVATFRSTTAPTTATFTRAFASCPLFFATLITMNI